MLNICLECYRCHRILNGANAVLYDIQTSSGLSPALFQDYLRVEVVAICNRCECLAVKSFVVDDTSLELFKKRVRQIFDTYKELHPVDVF